jgi:hypothetical protein
MTSVACLDPVAKKIAPRFLFICPFRVSFSPYRFRETDFLNLRTADTEEKSHGSQSTLGTQLRHILYGVQPDQVSEIGEYSAFEAPRV